MLCLSVDYYCFFFVTNCRYHVSPSKSSPDEHQASECEIMEIDSEVKHLINLYMIILTILKFLFVLHVPLHIGSLVEPASSLTFASLWKFFGGGAAIPQEVLSSLSSRDGCSAAN